MLWRVQSPDSRADMIETFEDLSLFVRQFSDDPLKIDNLSLLEFRSAKTH
jgi:hypothetical protein